VAVDGHGKQHRGGGQLGSTRLMIQSQADSDTNRCWWWLSSSELRLEQCHTRRYCSPGTIATLHPQGVPCKFAFKPV
jgi:hypothetical protein